MIEAIKDQCGCCEGVESITPQVIANRPGLDALRYRVGTHGAFLETMKARLSSLYLDIPSTELDENGKQRIDRLTPLQNLTTRLSNDPSIALLDAWATVADVLTFYQERIANEGYLRTATERRSVLELARLVGYQMRPGVASSVYLAYTLEDSQKEPVVIPAGAKAQSTPAGPDEQTQTFETSDPLEARPAWNVLKPRMTRPQTESEIQGDNDLAPRVYLKGISTNLKAGDPLLIVFGAQKRFYRILKLETDAAADRTLAELELWYPAQEARLVDRSPLVLRDISERYSDVEAFRVSGTGRTAQQALGLLQDLREADRPTAAEIHAQLGKLLEAVRENPRASRLQEWLSATVKDLGEALQTPEADFDEIATTLHRSPREFNLLADPLQNVLSRLVAARSVPPRNTFYLSRDADRLLARRTSDASVQVTMAFRSDLGEAVPVALANSTVTPDSSIQVYALRVKASLFGHNVSKEPQYEPILTADDPPANNPRAGQLKPQSQWPEWTPAGDEQPDTLFLNGSYSQILPGSYVAILKPDIEPLIVNGIDVRTESRNAYGFGGETTHIILPGDYRWWSGDEADITIIRQTTVYAHSEELELAEEPVTREICKGAGEDDSDWIELDRLYSDLKSGRWIVISGERTDVKDTNDQPVPGVVGSELVMLADVIQDVATEDGRPYNYIQENPAYDEGEGAAILAGDRIHTWIRLAKPLAYCYKRAAVTLYGNVVKATHGETRSEVLASGDASQALQTFTLRQPPLTYVSSPTPAGAEAALKVYVNDVRWYETDTLAWLGPNDHNYIIRIDDDGKTSVVFGTGVYGARLPTGQENVRAVYRKGIGKPGNVRARQIDQLGSRPLGVKSVINPIAASGGADRETRDQARLNAPLAVMALDRLVSVQDYADFARTFAGIGKAVARRMSDGHRELVHVTIAGADDIPIDESSDLYRNLNTALRRFGDPFQPFRVDMRELFLLVISANIRILPDRQWDVVASAIRARLLDTFSFQRRELGQDVLLGEVIHAIHTVPGVAYVDVEVFGGIPEKLVETTVDAQGRTVTVRRLLTPQEIAAKVKDLLDESRIDPGDPRSQRLGINIADLESGEIRPAQLALLSPQVPDTLILNRMEP